MAKAQSTTRAFGSPFKYIQGPGEINNLQAYCSAYSDKALALIDGFLFDDISNSLKPVFQDSATTLMTERFGGECSRGEADRVKELAKASGSGVLIGIGGGKTLDLAKIVADELAISLIVLPTSAASDAPTSAMSVMYTDEGEHRGNVRHSRGADIVLMDTDIICKAPLRLFVAGMGDALSTVFEAKANDASDSANYIGKGYRRCRAAMAIAQLSYDILIADGRKAVAALKRGTCTEAVENVIEANTLLSGLGFENTGCAAAHGIHSGLTELPGTHSYLHGEKVAFGVICQMMLENAPASLVDEVMRFCIDVGLPVSLAQLGTEATDKNISIVAHKVVHGNTLVYAQPMYFDEDTIFAAIVAADELGRTYLEKSDATRRITYA